MSKPSQRARYVVFLSHSSRDVWIAKRMAEKIEAIGAKCWFDEKDLVGGDVIVERILKGIGACHEAIVLISIDSVRSQWVPFEIGAARGQRKRVTPILKLNLKRWRPCRTLRESTLTASIGFWHN